MSALLTGLGKFILDKLMVVFNLLFGLLWDLVLWCLHTLYWVVAWVFGDFWTWAVGLMVGWLTTALATLNIPVPDFAGLLTVIGPLNWMFPLDTLVALLVAFPPFEGSLFVARLLYRGWR